VVLLKCDRVAEIMGRFWPTGGLLRHGTMNKQFNFVVIGFGFYCLLHENNVPCFVVLKTAKLLEYLERGAIIGSLIAL